MGKIAYSNVAKAREILQTPPDYGFHKIVYIRGTKEGYSNIKAQADGYFSSSRLRNKSLQAAEAMKNRYINVRNNANYNKIALTEEEIIKMQEEWVEAIGQGLSRGSGTGQVGSVLKAVQNAIWAFSKNSAKATAEEIEKYVVQLENDFNKLAPEDKKNLIGVVNPSQLEGNIVNIEEGQVVFSRLRATLNRLSQMTENHPYTFFVNMNRELGAIAEIGDTWALNKMENLVENTFLKSSLQGGKFISTGTQQVKNERGSFSTAKTDTMFVYEGSYNENQVLLQMGLSLKASGSVVGKDGKWEVKANNIPKIQIASIQGQENVWNLLTSIYGNSTLMENSTLNSLVWGGTSSNTIKLIKQDLISYYFERFLAGSGGKMSGGKFDIVDCLIVNGQPIPIIAVIAEVANQLVKSSGENSNFVFINLSFDRQWKGSSEKDMTLALARSSEMRSQIKNSLKMKISLNGNILYNFARKG